MSQTQKVKHIHLISRIAHLQGLREKTIQTCHSSQKWGGVHSHPWIATHDDITFAQLSHYLLGPVHHSEAFILQFICIHMCVCGLRICVASDLLFSGRFYISLLQLTWSTHRLANRGHKTNLLKHILQIYHLDISPHMIPSQPQVWNHSL